MTLDEFFEHLKLFKSKGLVNHSPCIFNIRFVDPDNPQFDYYCPITAVCKIIKGFSVDIYGWKSAADDIGLPLDIAIKIAYTADNAISSEYYDTEIRTKLEEIRNS